ncbi:MAG: VOC family protein [Phycisphaeraceae bacterium]|nr:VOC family protein [Phycisphaerales bacterium]MCB9859624.1 VOC family protein [Phycisphaeraceae bacterium]
MASLPQSTGLIPHLTVDGAIAAIEFYTQAFDAKELFRAPAEDGKRLMHASMQIGHSVIFLNDDFPEMCGGVSRHPNALRAVPMRLHQNVSDVDTAHAKAVRAGATTVLAPADMFWGDRYSIVKDPFGHEWSFSTPIKPS